MYKEVLLLKAVISPQGSLTQDLKPRNMDHLTKFQLPYCGLFNACVNQLQSISLTLRFVPKKAL